MGIKPDVNSVKSINSTPINEPSSSRETKLLQNTNTSVLIPSTQDTSGHHKHCPKPKGKHFRLMPPVDKVIASETSVKPAKSAFVTVTHGLCKIKCLRHYKCKMCDTVSDSQAGANAQYHTSHPQLSCDKCNQIFNNPSSLRHHLYNHKELKFPCRSCDKCYVFESYLNNHRLKHRRHPGHQFNHCVQHGICSKWFFAKSD